MKYFFAKVSDVEILEIDGLYHSMPELDNVCNESTLAIHYMKEVKAIEITINKRLFLFSFKNSHKDYLRTNKFRTENLIFKFLRRKAKFLKYTY